MGRMCKKCRTWCSKYLRRFGYKCIPSKLRDKFTRDRQNNIVNIYNIDGMKLGTIDLENIIQNTYENENYQEGDGVA